MNNIIARRVDLRRGLAIVLAAFMVLSIIAGGAVAQDEDDEIADEIYIDEAGNAVLVFDEESTDSSTGEFGVDVAEGMVYLLVTDELEEDISAAFDMWVDPERVESTGAFDHERPAAINDFSLDASVVQSAQENRMDGSFDVEIDPAQEPRADFVVDAETEGTIESSVDHFQSEGHAYLELAEPMGTVDEELGIGIAGTGGEYVVEIDQVTALTEFAVDRWETEDAAQETLEQQFASIAAELGGEATVTIHDHNVSTNEHDQTILDISYTIEYVGIDGAADVLAEELAADPSLDLDADEAEEFVTSIFDLEIEGIGIGYVEDGPVTATAWDIDVQNMAPIAYGMIDLMEASDDDLTQLGVFDDLRTQLEAQEAANVIQTADWSMAVDRTAQGMVTISAEIESEADNWATYVNELSERGIEQDPALHANMYGDIVDDEISVEFDVEMSHDDLLDEAAEVFRQELEDDPTVDEQTLAVWDAFEAADLQIAGIDFDMADGTTTITAAAHFEDITAFETVLAEEFHGLSVIHIYGDIAADRDTMYVYAMNVFDPDATEDDVRDHPAVDGDTDIHFVESLEDLPRFDLQTAGDFLDIDTEEFSPPTMDVTDDDDVDDEIDDDVPVDDDDGLPGFGIIAAFVALLSSLVIMRSRE